MYQSPDRKQIAHSPDSILKEFNKETKCESKDRM